MTKTNLLRRVVEALAAGRARQAERFVSEYMKSHRADHKPQG